MSEAQEGQTCVAACYECLLNYANQNEPRYIDRNVIKDFLTQLRSSRTSLVDEGKSRDEQYEWLKNHLDPKSSLEKGFLEFLYNSGLRLPDAAQKRPSADVMVQTDFFYERDNIQGVCIFIDGPNHDSDEARKHNEQVRKSLQDRGFKVVAIRYDRDFESQIRELTDVFGT